MSDRQEALARALHEAYVEQRLAAGDELGSTASLAAWNELPEEFRESSRRNARDVASILGSLGYQVRKARDGKESRLTDEDIEAFAEEMHVRWVAEREAEGWRTGPERHDDDRVHPDLVPWDRLPESRREIDRSLVRALPALLRDVGLVLCKEE